ETGRTGRGGTGAGRTGRRGYAGSGWLEGGFVAKTGTANETTAKLARRTQEHLDLRLVNMMLILCIGAALGRGYVELSSFRRELPNVARTGQHFLLDGRIRQGD